MNNLLNMVPGQLDSSAVSDLPNKLKEKLDKIPNKKRASEF